MNVRKIPMRKEIKKEPVTLWATGSSHAVARTACGRRAPKLRQILRRGRASRRGRRRRRVCRSGSCLSIRGGLGFGPASGQTEQADHGESNYRPHWSLLFSERNRAHRAKCHGMQARPYGSSPLHMWAEKMFGENMWMQNREQDAQAWEEQRFPSVVLRG